MLTLVIQAANINALTQAYFSAPDDIDCVELRIDALESIPLDALQKLCDRKKKPILLTLRHQDAGGQFQGSHHKHQQCLLQLAKLNVDYM